MPELLFQFVAGESSEEAIERGHTDLGDQCRRAAREGLLLLYSMIEGPWDTTARAVLERIDNQSGRLTNLDA